MKTLARFFRRLFGIRRKPAPVIENLYLKPTDAARRIC